MAFDREPNASHITLFNIHKNFVTSKGYSLHLGKLRLEVT